MIITRVWAMPSAETFSIPPIADLLQRYLGGWGGAVIIDPFARASCWGTIRNDLDPAAPTEYHMEAAAFCDHLHQQGCRAGAVLFDPPYSPRQISEMYKRVGLAVGMEGTQNGRLYKVVRDGLDRLLVPGGLAISCGWNSAGFGSTRGYAMLEILLVAHGGAHNDTIVVVEQKV